MCDVPIVRPQDVDREAVRRLLERFNREPLPARTTSDGFAEGGLIHAPKKGGD